ncbi:MAG TPA: hypothetical protein P5069_12205 [Candidatus Hydrogenedentes bacterium]|nr:hypothetical protein [Candidatus Hydrogenedentota bacterium]
MPAPDRLRRHVEKRRRIVRAFPIAGGGLLLLLSATEGWLLSTKPLFANPLHVAERVRADTLAPGTQALMAAMLPVMVQLCMLLALAVVVFAFAAWSNERKCLELIDYLDDQAGMENRSGENVSGGEHLDAQ